MLVVIIVIATSRSPLSEGLIAVTLTAGSLRGYDAFTKERAAESAYRHFQNKYQKRKEKGWRNMAPMRKEKHELKEALANEQARDAVRWRRPWGLQLAAMA